MQSREALLAEHGPMVDAVARRLRRDMALDVELADLVSEGYAGLFEAADRFDESLGVPFGAWAQRRVHGAMVDWLRRNARVSRRAHERCERDAAVRTALEEAEVHAASEGEPAPDRGALGEALDAMLAQVSASFVVTLDAQQEGRRDPEEAFLTEEERAAVRAAVASLTEQQRNVVHWLFYREARQEEVARELGISRIAVAKTSARALAALRDKLR